ncbi:Hsp20/alpha crystallin family protein [Clostridium sp.]|uniref:Hsp20/alpha crystallin family protein n=1 Tax=Clostridium sp. TaxID=1506 RepID=UPI002FC69D2A
MVIRNPRNKFSLIKEKSYLNKLVLNPEIIKDNVSVNILDNPSKYTISIYLGDLCKDSIILSYINNFLVIDFKFKGSQFSSLNYKRTFYLKDIDITKIQNIYAQGLIHITLPKKND